MIAEVNRCLAQFRKKAGVDENNGSKVRVADAFGLEYAAGRLAKTYTVFPKCLNCLAPALACYRLNPVPRSNLVRLADRLPPIEDRIRQLTDDEAIRRVPMNGRALGKVAQAISGLSATRGTGENVRDHSFRYGELQRVTTSRFIGASLESSRFCAAKLIFSSAIAAWRFSTSTLRSSIWTPRSLCDDAMSRPE